MFVSKAPSPSGAIVAVLVVFGHLMSLGETAPAAKVLLESSPSDCMTQWLSNLGIDSKNVSSYVSMFHREDITEKALRLLTLQDLETVGITKFVHRVLIHNYLQEDAVLCGNGGECNPINTVENAFQCDCLDGFEGNSCESITSCSAHVCLNGGTCSELEGGEVECHCTPGYSGDRCELDPCHSKPCQNGGSCTVSNGSYNCSCPLGYTGTNCQSAWLTQSEYTSFKAQTSFKIKILELYTTQLSNSIDMLDQKVEEAKNINDGPRFFSHWISMDQGSDIVQIETFNDHSTEYISVLYSNDTISTYSFTSNGNFFVLQTLNVTDAAAFVLFNIDGTVYLAVAKNSSDGSEVYEWRNDNFVFHHKLSTKGARDVAFVSTPRQGDYLIFSCSYQTVLINYPTIVYKWVLGQFHVYQYLETVTNASTVDSVVTESEEVLIVLTHRLENGESSTLMYHWNGTYFDDRVNKSQTIPAVPLGTKLFPFVIGVHTFLIGQSLSDNSIASVFRYEEHSRQFIQYADIDTPGTLIDVDYLNTSKEHFLILANSQEPSSSSTLPTQQNNVLVYRIDGAGFQLFQDIRTTFRPSVLRHFSKDQCTGIVVASSDGNAELYQWSDTASHCSSS